ncbi:MAG: hypothetical protein ACK5S6_00800 [bacterium]
MSLINIPCITPQRLIKRAAAYCFHYRGCRTKLLNELAKYDCAHARYWIKAINDIG